MIEYFSEPKSLGVNVKVELGLSHYATTANLKNATVDTSNCAKGNDLVNLKSDAGKLNIDKL